MKPFVKKESPSCSTSEENSSQRPKRSTCQKNLDGSNGLSWREENDLKRALYASLQETRRKNLDEDEVDDSDGLKTPPMEEPLNEQEEILKKAKVHAQRKFAQGSNPNSPLPTPQKAQCVSNSTTELLPYRRPKTEDFLTFLCLRGTSILPPSLDFLNCCSKSDSSSDCRSLSPDLEIKDCSDSKENIRKTSDSRDRGSLKHDGLANGVSRKFAACKASSKRHPDSSHHIKKSSSRSQRDASVIKKRKSRDEGEDVEFIPSKSVHSRGSMNGRTRSSTLHALKEKYKKQRLASDKKKLLPPKQASQSSSLTTTRSRDPSKEKNAQHTSKAIRSSPPVLNKVKQTQADKRLAVEKRKSLRSAHVSKNSQRKLLGSNKKTLWSRRAKLVPPIVDADSDSEPEIVASTDVKRTSHAVPNKHTSSSNSARLSERLRNKTESVKEVTKLTSRQILLRKHMQNRLKAKKSALHSQNIKSKAINKKTTARHILKKVVKKNLTSKTITLRKDLQNKRVTRSAKHQIEEMLWSNPEKKTKLPSGKTSVPSRIGTKRASVESSSSSKRQKLNLRSKTQDNKNGNLVEKGGKTAGDSAKTSQNPVQKVKKVLESSKLNRSSKTSAGNDPKPCSSTSSEKEVLQNKSKLVSLNKPLDHKVSKPSELPKTVDKKGIKAVEDRASKITNKGSRSELQAKITTDPKKPKLLNSKVDKLPETAANKLSNPGCSRNSNPLTPLDVKGRENMSKVNAVSCGLKSSNVSLDSEKSLKSLNKDNLNLKRDNNVGESSKFQKSKETSVQNNLNCLKSDKNINKDISQLFSFNVECEQSVFVPYSEPGCSNIGKEEKIKKLNVEKLSQISTDNILVKKHNDKKYLKNASCKLDKSLVKTSNKTPLKDFSKSTETMQAKMDIKEVNSAKTEITSSDSEASLDIDILATFRNIPGTSRGENIKYSAENHSHSTPINDLSNSTKKDSINKYNIDALNCSNLKDASDQNKKSEHKKDVKQKSEHKEKSDKLGCSNLKRESSNSEKNKTTDIKWQSMHNTTSNSYKINEQLSDDDDDSDYDITLDQYLKLKSDTHVSDTSSGCASSVTKTEEGCKTQEPKMPNVSKDTKNIKKEFDKESGRSKKEGESSKHKKDKENSKSKSHDKSKKEDKNSKKDTEKSLAKLLKRERSKSNKKEDKEKLKHKRDGSSSSKSSKRELEKDGSKLNKKDSEKEGTSTEKKVEGKSEFSEKKEKTSKKESSKLSRSNSCDDSKSPKKKKKFDEFKNIEKIKNLISNSSILNEVSGFKEFKRRLSSDKSELKKLKSKKRKKLSLLKDKKLSKKLSSKLLRKYSKKKELKKKKLKKKELKKDKAGEGSKMHSKNKKQKHKDKDHHRRESLDKKNVNPHSTVEATSNLFAPNNMLALSKSTGTQHQDHQKLESVTTCAQTSVSNIISPLTKSSDILPIETKCASHQKRNANKDSSFVSHELNSTSDEAFSNEAALSTTKDSVAQVPLHFIQDTTPKTMTDAATNTCEEDLDESPSPIPEHLRSDEMSVGTQTITPVGSPSPVELCPVVPPVTPQLLPSGTKCITIQGTTKLPVAKPPGVMESPMIRVPYTLLHKSLTPVVLANPQLVAGSPTISVQSPNIVKKTNIFPLSPVKSEMIVPVQNLVKVELKKDYSSKTTPAAISPLKQVPFSSSPVLTQSKATVTKIVHISTIPAESRKICPPSVLTPVPVKPTMLSNSKPSSDSSQIPVKLAPSNPLNIRRSSEGSVTSTSLASTSTVTLVKPKTSLPEGVPSTSETVTSPKVVQNNSTPTQSSPKVKKRGTVKKTKVPECPPTKLEPFPLDTAKMVSAPVFYPTAEEFSDPLDYINKIRSEAEQYGICKIVPPSSFKPECKVNDDMRFTAYNQYLHKMLYRWGPNVQHTACIKKHLKTQKVKLEQAPLIGGIELDLSKFYQKVQQLGGLQQVIEKKKWQKVADVIHVPKTAQDRVTKLYDAYCKYLVSYDTLSSEDKKKLLEEVLTDHEKRVKTRSSSNEQEKEDFDDEENFDCVTRGRSMSLSNFFRIARNTMSMWFKNEPSPDEVEHELWKIVTEREQHVVVHVGNIDSAVTQSGFPTSKSSFAKHPWNLKILTNNSKSVLKSMGPISGITIPTLHVGMLFTTGCWYRDPHSCAWIEYLHTGASKIWYGVPANGCEKFRSAMSKIMPEYCSNRPLWLSVDTAMVPPDLLVKHGASLSRTIQSSGQFVVIFPGSFTSSICCGYSVSESVYFAPISWLDIATKAFQDIRSSCESPAFALEKLLFNIGNDPKPQLKILEKILPMVESIRLQELNFRNQLNELGLKQFERLPLAAVRDKKKKSKTVNEENDLECDICHTPCYISMVVYPQEDGVYCPAHAIEHIEKKNFKLCKLQFAFSENDLNELVKKITDLVSTLPNSITVKKKSPKKKTSEK